MSYARTTSAGVESGAFATLWPNTSASNEAGFAASEGYAPVLDFRAHSAATETLESCPVYSDADTFYSVRVVPLALSAIADGVTTIVQARLDDFAQSRGFESILSATTYASSSVARFAADGKTAVDARDATWASCYAVLDDVQSGAAPMPTLEQLIAKLPVLGWPE